MKLHLSRSMAHRTSTRRRARASSAWTRGSPSAHFRGSSPGRGRESECARPWRQGPRRCAQSPRVPGDGRSTDSPRDLEYVSARAVLDRPVTRTGCRVARPPPQSPPHPPAPLQRLLLGCPPWRRAHQRTQFPAPPQPFDAPHPPCPSPPPRTSTLPATQGNEASAISTRLSETCRRIAQVHRADLTRYSTG